MVTYNMMEKMATFSPALFGWGTIIVAIMAV